MNTALTSVINKISGFSTERQQDAVNVLNMFADQEISSVRLSNEQQANLKKRMEGKIEYAPKDRVNTFFSKMFI